MVVAFICHSITIQGMVTVKVKNFSEKHLRLFLVFIIWSSALLLCRESHGKLIISTQKLVAIIQNLIKCSTSAPSEFFPGILDLSLFWNTPFISVDESLKRLGVEYLDCVGIHDPEVYYFLCCKIISLFSFPLVLTSSSKKRCLPSK